jgi:hypothetical protein
MLGVSPVVPIVELALPKLHATFAFVVRHEGINSLYAMRYRAAQPRLWPTFWNGLRICLCHSPDQHGEPAEHRPSQKQVRPENTRFVLSLAPIGQNRRQEINGHAKADE